MVKSMEFRSDHGSSGISMARMLWCLASLVPLTFVSFLFALSFYGIPESDDFCLSYLHLENGFVGGISILYNSLSGRVVPLFLIQLPVAISDITGIDYFKSYPATLAALMLLFFAGILFASFRLRTDKSVLRPVFFGCALAAVMLSEAPLPREMLYWLPGVVCYTLPGIILVIVLNEFIRAVERGACLSRLTTGLLAVGCLVASLSNEFTPVSLVAIVVSSLALRAFFNMRLEMPAHAIIGGAALCGFFILVAAPGNSVRMAQFPVAGLLLPSLMQALADSFVDLIKFMIRPIIPMWLIAVVLYTATEAEPVDACARKRRYLAAFVIVFCLGSGYLAYFAHQFSTGLHLSERARNQTATLLVFGLTISAVLLARASREWLRLKLSAFISLQQYGPGSNAIPLALAAMLVPPLYFSKTARTVRTEVRSFQTFWIESTERHRKLSAPAPTKVAVSRYTVFPTTLMGGDIGDDPSRLPNDCIARFYKKDAVVLDRAPPSTK